MRATQVIIVVLACILTDHCQAEPSAEGQVSTNVFTVSGEVGNPGVYAWTNGLTLLRGIEIAGGFKSNDWRRVVCTPIGAVHIPQGFRPTNRSERTIFRFRSCYNHLVVDTTRVGTERVPDPRIERGCGITVPSKISQGQLSQRRGRVANNSVEDIGSNAPNPQPGRSARERRL